MNVVLQNILRHVQDHQGGAPCKPAVLPISSISKMDDFNEIDENCYIDVVREYYYFFFLSIILHTRMHARILSHSFILLNKYIIMRFHYLYFYINLYFFFFFLKVKYLHYIGGFNLKKAINLCFKEALNDSLTLSFTWWGREKKQKSLYNARIIIAIYGIISFFFLFISITIIMYY